MSDYIVELEKQNAELQQRLGKLEKIVDTNALYSFLFTPKWHQRGTVNWDYGNNGFMFAKLGKGASGWQILNAQLVDDMYYIKLSDCDIKCNLKGHFVTTNIEEAKSFVEKKYVEFIESVQLKLYNK